MSTGPRLVEVRQNVLKQNDLLARALRRRFRAAGVYVVSLVSSPGAGKTTFLEKTLSLLRRGRGLRVAALVGDLATDNDAARLARAGVPVRQITTGTVCHLDAEMVGRALEGWDLAVLDILFIENVGNLVCPALFDLGEAVRIVLASVTEGADKPAKYPHMFSRADVVLVSKTDLLPYVDFDVGRHAADVRQLSPGARLMQVSAVTGDGMQAWYDWLQLSLPG